MLPPRIQLEDFSSAVAHYKRAQERPGVNKLLAYEKKVNEGFAKTG